MGRSISARKSSAVRTVSPASAPTEKKITIIACCRPLSWGAWPFQGRPPDARIRRQPERRRKTGLRTQREPSVHRDNAVKRWFDSHHARIAPLRPIYLGDDLFACHPVCKMVTDAGDDFI